MVSQLIKSASNEVEQMSMFELFDTSVRYLLLEGHKRDSALDLLGTYSKDELRQLVFDRLVDERERDLHDWMTP